MNGTLLIISMIISVSLIWFCVYCAIYFLRRIAVALENIEKWIRFEKE